MAEPQHDVQEPLPDTPPPAPEPDEDDEDDDEPEDEESEDEEPEEEEADEPEPEPAKKKPAAKKKKRTASARAASPLKELRRQEEQEIVDWLSALSSTTTIDVALKRTWPERWNNVHIKGTLAHYDGPVTEDEVAAVYGGGKFQVIVHKVLPSGKKEYAGARTFEIPGAPKLDSLPGMESDEDDAPAQPAASDHVVGQALHMAHQLTRDAQRRADQYQSKSGMDWQAMETLMAPLREQIKSLSTENVALQQRLWEKAQEKPDRSHEDRLLGIMENKETGYANALQQLRMEHEKELRQLREFNQEEIKRREARFERELEATRQAADREIRALTTAHQQALDSQRLGYEGQIEGKKSELSRLERELKKVEVELAELRGRKDMTPLDQIQGLVQLKSGFDALMPDAPEQKSGFERWAETLSPLIDGVAQRVGGAGQHPGAGQQQPYDDGDELVTVRDPETGQMRQVPKRIIRQAQARRAQQQARAQEQGLPADAPPLEDAEVKAAVSFIESAFQAGTDPGVFARSARSMVPAAILQYLAQVGVDPFLDRVAKLDSGSPLASVAGRKYIRDVADHLLGKVPATDG